MMLLRALWAYRGFVLGSVKREFQLKYRNSLLGAAWTILNPMAMIFVYTVIFAQVMKAKLPGVDSVFAYSIYLCSGVLTWGLFTETLNSLVNVFLTNANILKKLSFPRICLPIIVTASAFINFLIIFGLFVLFLIVTGNFPGMIFFEIIPVLIVQMLFTLGLGIILGVLNVFVRDVGQFVNILLQFWFWFTPIVYVSKTLPEWVSGLLAYNPMATIIGSYQNVMLYHQSPNWLALFPVTVLSVILFLFAWRLFKKHAADIVDEI